MRACAICGSPLEELGTHSLVDYEGRWTVEATKYRCFRGQHITFVTNSYDVDEEVVTPWVEAKECIMADLNDADWYPGEVSLSDDTKFDLESTTCRSLEDLRSELAERAVKVFETIKTREPKYSGSAYDFIEALRDVDEELQNHGQQLEKAGFKKAHDPVGGGGGTGRSDFPAGSRGED